MVNFFNIHQKALLFFQILILFGLFIVFTAPFFSSAGIDVFKDHSTGEKKTAEEVGLINFDEVPIDVDDPNSGVSQTGHRNLGAGLYKLKDIFMNIANVFAIFWLLWSGFKMVTSQGEEEQISEGKRGVTWGLTGLVLLLMVDKVVIDVFFGQDLAGPVADERTMSNSINEGTELVVALLEWFKGLVVLIAVGYVMLSGLGMITSLGSSEELVKYKNGYKWIAVGIIVILLNNILIQEVFYPYVLGIDGKLDFEPDAARGISEIISVVQYFLIYLSIGAFVVFLYGGGQMILAFGNEEAFGKGKTTLIGALIGIVIILVSFALVSTFLGMDLSS